MLLLPPRSPLFPYTTLFRSTLMKCMQRVVLPWVLLLALAAPAAARQATTVTQADVQRLQDRSEEHTSELQSLRHLVCRLLLEKKKEHDKFLRPPSHHRGTAH